MKVHEQYIKRCITLAKNGLGTTYTNPLVGSVIVCDGKIIGEGWHQKAGEAHAEVNAINNVKDKALLKRATIYINLEPCSHFGKTPPCCDLILQKQISNVVIGSIDPFAKVSGNGIKRLIESGTTVTVGILEKECNDLNRRFFTFHKQKRPYIILKWAESKDGFISPLTKKEKKPIWITNKYSRQLVHKWRSEEQAILIGTQTILDDNPKLNVRDWTGNNPIRIVLDKSLKLSKDYFVFDTSAKTIIVNEKKQKTETPNCVYEKISFNDSITKQITAILYKHNIQSVIIEGGKQTLQTFIDANYWNEARVFKGNINLNNGTKAPVLNLGYTTKQMIFDDELLIYNNHDQHDNF